MIEIVKQACDRAGSIAKLAAVLGIKPQAIHQWDKVPAERVLPIERATGVSRHDLRPDLYPRNEAPTISQEAQTAAM